jgi:hypothetical protein
VTIRTGYSLASNSELAARELSEQLMGEATNFVVFFASSSLDPHSLGVSMAGSFGSATIIGCTTAGEISSGAMLKNSVVAMAFDGDSLEDLAVGLLNDLTSKDAMTQGIRRLEESYGRRMIDLDVAKYVGIVLVDGLSRAEERLMETIGDLTNITVIGGSAGDDLQFKSTHVFAHGKAHSNAAVLAILKPKAGFDILKTQSFRDTGKLLNATQVSEAERMVLQFNGEPATHAYAKALGVSVEEAESKYMSNPVGLMLGDEPYVRSPQHCRGQAMVFYCNVKSGMELHLLESTDIVRDTRIAFENKKRELGTTSGAINFHCILRTLELEQRGETEEYGKIFEGVPTIGFSTYGEQYIGHINQTSTMLLFK